MRAAQELVDWYKQYEEQLSQTRKANKEQQDAQEVPEVGDKSISHSFEKFSLIPQHMSPNFTSFLGRSVM